MGARRPGRSGAGAKESSRVRRSGERSLGRTRRGLKGRLAGASLGDGGNLSGAWKVWKRTEVEAGGLATANP